MLFPLLLSIFSETPTTETPPTTEVTSGVGQETPNVIEIDPEATYVLKGSAVENARKGDVMWKETMRAKDYTQGKQQLSAAQKSNDEQIVQYKQQVEQLNNQVLKMKLGNDYQEATTTPPPQQQQTEPVQQEGATQTPGYDWLYEEPEAPPASTAQQVIPPTPNGLSSPQQYNNVVKLLLQHPDIQQSFSKMVNEEVTKQLVTSTQQQNDTTQLNELNTQAEQKFKEQWGDAGSEFVYGYADALYAKSSIPEVFSVADKFGQSMKAKLREEIIQETEQERKSAVEQAISAPIEVEIKDDDSPREIRDKRKKDALRRTALIK